MTSSRTLLAALALLTACAGGSDGPATPDTSTTLPTDDTATSGTEVDTGTDPSMDTDQDGLTDLEELELGTSPLLVDTDGDGLSDGDELIRLGFDPRVDPIRFNPLVADLPEIDIRLTSAPSVTVHGTTSTQTSVAYGVSSSSEVADSYTTSSSYGVANATETSSTWDTELEVSASLFDFGGSASAGYSETETRSRETTVNYGNDYTEESRYASERSHEQADTEGVTLESASLVTTFDVVNTGNLSYTIASLTLSARHRDLTNPSIEVPLGSLVAEDLSGWSGLSQAPGDQFTDIVFRTDDLSWEQGVDLLDDPSGLVLSVSSYELLDANGRAYALNGTDLQARTAKVLIDFGPDRDPLRVRVATNGRVDDEGRPEGIGVVEALSSVLGLDASFGEEGLDIDGKLTRVGRRELWRAVSNCAEAEEGQDADAWTLRAGNVLELVWLDDSDGDHLFEREEALHGTSNDDPDTDGDSLTDYDEVRLFSSDPLSRDGDADGLLDATEIEFGTDPSHPDTDGDWLFDGEDSAPLVATPMIDQSGVWSLDGHLQADSLGDDEGVVIGVDFFATKATYAADRLDRESHALQLMPGNELYVYHPTLHGTDDGYGNVTRIGGISAWLRIDQLPSDNTALLGGLVDVFVNQDGELSLVLPDYQVASVGSVAEGEWFHLIVAGESEGSSMFFDVWLDGQNGGSVPVWWHNGWLTDPHEFTVGGHDTHVTVDQVSVLQAIPAAVNLQQLANQGSF